jgi:hypothetical protein
VITLIKHYSKYDTETVDYFDTIEELNLYLKTLELMNNSLSSRAYDRVIILMNGGKKNEK